MNKYSLALYCAMFSLCNCNDSQSQKGAITSDEHSFGYLSQKRPHIRRDTPCFPDNHYIISFRHLHARVNELLIEQGFPECAAEVIYQNISKAVGNELKTWDRTECAKYPEYAYYENVCLDFVRRVKSKSDFTMGVKLTNSYAEIGNLIEYKIFACVLFRGYRKPMVGQVEKGLQFQCISVKKK